MEKAWRVVGKTILGGPAYNSKGEEFIPGKYLKYGHLITSRGCPNYCWFCQAWKNEGNIRELPIYNGWIIHDNNLLATSKDHQENVFNMILKQPEKPRFAGGFEAQRFTEWHLEWMYRLKPKTIWFAYDTPDDKEPLFEVSKLLKDFFRTHIACCYVLIGYDGDTIKMAETRLRFVLDLGFMPQAMLYNRRPEKEWRRFQREWANRVIVGSKMKKLEAGK